MQQYWCTEKSWFSEQVVIQKNFFSTSSSQESCQQFVIFLTHFCLNQYLEIMNWQNFFQCHQSGACVVCLVASWEELGVEVIKQQILIKSEIYKEEKIMLDFISSCFISPCETVERIMFSR